MAVDAAGNIYVADQGNNLIRKITPAGVVSTVAGSGSSGFSNGTSTSATFNTPTNVGLDQAGNLYVADTGNGAIRKISTAGVVSTLATGFVFPREIRADGAGNLYVADEKGFVIKKISPGGVVTTLAGTGQEGSNDGNWNVATFEMPIGLALDGNGNLFVADGGTIRKIGLSGYTIDKPLPVGLSFDPKTGIISGTPTALSPATNYTITAYNGSGSNSTVINIEVVSAIVPKPSIITFPPPVHIDIGADNVLHPAATSTNTQTPITYTSSNPNIVYLGADGQLHVIAPGVTTITASQNGNAYYTAATPVSEVYTIMEDQIIFFPAVPVKTTCDADFDCGAITSNTLLPLTYNSSNTSVATISTQGTVHVVGAGSTVITVSQAGNSLYYSAVPQSQTLTVNGPVVPVVTIAPDRGSVCSGTSVTFTATVANLNTNLSYQWQVNGVNAGTNSATFTTSPASVTDVFRCLVTNTASCNAVGTSNAYTGIVINSYITPSLTISSSPGSAICSGTLITFAATPANGGSSPAYQWLVNGINTGSNTATFAANNLNEGDVVTCVLTNNSSPCLTATTATSNAITVQLSIPNPPPSVTIVASVTKAYIGTPITFTAIPANAGTVTHYQWQVNGTNVGYNNPTYTTDASNNNDVVTCTITSNIPCSTPASSTGITLQITPAPEIVIPNTFTPNGDGINDNWEIPSLVNYPGCLVSVYDRNGALLFQSKGYSTPWDGTFKGKALSVSTYYYIIKPAPNSESLSGYVTLVK